MAQRKLPSTSARIFKKKPTFASRLISAALLTLSLLVVLVGIGTAVYLDRARAPAPQQQAAAEAPAPPPAAPAVQQQAAAEAPSPPAVPPSPAPPPHDPPAAAAPSVSPSEPEAVAPVVEPPAAPAAAEIAPPAAAATAETASPAAAPAPETATSLALIEPQAGEPAEPASDAGQAPPEATPPQPVPAEAPVPPTGAITPTPDYWVEYGVYVGKTYAQRLKRKLAEQGLESVVVRTQTPSGRRLLRVRSDRVKHAVAVAAATTAHRALKIRPLIHRDHRASPSAAGIAVAAAAPRGYWVQYGAFAYRHNAQRLGHELTRHGLHAKVYIRRGKSGKPLYLVRSSGLPDHASAAELVQRYKHIATAEVLIGHSRGFHGRHEDAGSRQAPEPDERQRPAFQRTG